MGSRANGGCGRTRGTALSTSVIGNTSLHFGRDVVLLRVDAISIGMLCIPLRSGVRDINSLEALERIHGEG